MSNDDVRQRLETQCAQEIAEAAAQLLADPNAEVGERMRRIEVYSKLLAVIQPQPSHTRSWAIGVAVAMAVVLGLSWSLRVYHTPITLTLQSDVVRIEFDQPLLWSDGLPLVAGPIYLDALTTVEAPGLFPNLQSAPGDAWLRIEEGDVSLEKLDVQQNDAIEIESVSHAPLEVSVYTRSAVTHGRLQAQGTVHVLAGPAPNNASIDVQSDLLIPETIDFSRRQEGVVPMRFRVRPGTSWRLQNLRVQSLRFSRQISRGVGDTSFVSTIKKGTLTLHDAAESVMLREGDHLSLAGVKGRLVELRGGDSLDLIFEGTITKVLTGPEGFKRNLMPSWFTYVSHNQPLIAFWSAVVFLWGILWSLRTTIFS